MLYKLDSDINNNEIKYGISYGRISSSENTNKKFNSREEPSLEAQKSRCANFAKFLVNKKGCEHIIIEHLSDDCFSGKTTNRPGYVRMWDLISSKKISFIIATEVSRISRSVTDFVELVSHCEANDVNLIIIQIDLDTSTAVGRLLVTLLAALAEFESEINCQRVKNNSLDRLLREGKINGSAEILGLDRDPNKVGHYLINHEELAIVEKIFNLYLTMPNKNKTYTQAKKLGFTGKKGKELTHHVVDTVIENARWRYRGKWFINKKNINKNQESLPEKERFQIVDLPHGPLINLELLDQVVEKFTTTYEKNKRTGKSGRTYLLSHILKYEDNTSYYGGPAKSRQYFYYYSNGDGPNIPCDKIENRIIEFIMNFFRGHKDFSVILKNEILKRVTSLPKFNAEIKQLKKEIDELNEMDNELGLECQKRNNLCDPDFMNWLEKNVTNNQKLRIDKENQLQVLINHCSDLQQNSGLDDIEKSKLAFIEKFSQLSGDQKRNIIELIISKIVVKGDGDIDIYVFSEK